VKGSGEAKHLREDVERSKAVDAIMPHVQALKGCRCHHATRSAFLQAPSSVASSPSSANTKVADVFRPRPGLLSQQKSSPGISPHRQR